MADEFSGWGRTFAPKPVIFQIGYPSDRRWWRKLRDPVVEMGQSVCAGISQTCGVARVDFTLRGVTPDVFARPAGGGDDGAT